MKDEIIDQANEKPKVSFLKKLGKLASILLPIGIAVFSKLNDEGKAGFVGGVAKKIDDEKLLQKKT